MVKKVHQVWFGEPPSCYIQLFMLSVRKYSQEWEYKLWGEADIDQFPEYARAIRQLIWEQKYSFANDLFRVAIIAKHGGCYVDTDFEFYGPLDIMLEKYSHVFSEGKEALFCNEWGTTAGGFFYVPVSGSPMMKEIADDVQRMFDSPEGFSIHTLKDIHARRDDKIYLLPVEFCFPYNLKQFAPRNPPEGSLMAHHWTASWKDARVRQEFYRKHKIAAKYLLERNPDLA